jgi:isopenicillin-N epimerase
MHNAVAEALTFYQGVGRERKLARLRYLRDRWARRLEPLPRIRLLTSFDPQMAGGLATVGIDGIEPGRISTHLWDRYRIIVTPIVHAEFQGVRVTPNVYTTLAEVDAFTEVMESLAKNGLS